MWGYGNKRHSAADCCSDCLNYKPSGPDEWGCNCESRHMFALSVSYFLDVIYIYSVLTHNVNLVKHGPKVLAHKLVTTLDRYIEKHFFSLVWVYCGNKTACGNQYRDCWLKHAVGVQNTCSKLLISSALPQSLCSKSMLLTLTCGKSLIYCF